ncbi:chitinase [Vibrio sp. TBV020]|uniref:chitinase n=1 Tax=Vibrio sp. TBV020 TaxID=3137398 RepID=UPI0038CD3693
MKIRYPLLVVSIGLGCNAFAAQLPFGADKQPLENAVIQWVTYWDKEVTSACYTVDGNDLGCSSDNLTFTETGEDWATKEPMGESSGLFPIPNDMNPGEGTFDAVIKTCTSECTESTVQITFGNSDSGNGNGNKPSKNFSLLPTSQNPIYSGTDKPTLAQLNEEELNIIEASPSAALIKQQLLSARFIKGDIKLDFSNPASLPENVKTIMSVFSEEDWNYLFPMRKSVYQYEGFLEAAARYPALCNDNPKGEINQESLCKLELSTMFAHFTQEVGAHLGNGYVYEGEQLDEYRQGLYYIEEAGCEANEDGVSRCTGYNGGSSKDVWQGVGWPGYPNAQYYGRGAKQLSYNYNYAPFSKVMFGNDQVLLENPHLVGTEGALSIGSAVYFYMQPRSPKPSIHDVVVGRWEPNALDLEYGREEGFGVTINVINGGVECGGSEPAQGVPSQPRNREIYYKGFAEYFGIWDNLDLASQKNDCWNQMSFGDDSSAAAATFWEKSWTEAGKGQLVSYEASPYNIFFSGDYAEFIKKSFYHSVNGVVVLENISEKLGSVKPLYDGETSFISNRQIVWSGNSLSVFDPTMTDLISTLQFEESLSTVAGLSNGNILVAYGNNVEVITLDGSTIQKLSLDSKVMATDAVRIGFRNNKQHNVVIATESSVYEFKIQQGKLNQKSRKATQNTTMVAANEQGKAVAHDNNVKVFNDTYPDGYRIQLAHEVASLDSLYGGGFVAIGGTPAQVTVIRSNAENFYTKSFELDADVRGYSVAPNETGGFSVVGQSASTNEILVNFYTQSGEKLTTSNVHDENLLAHSVLDRIQDISAETLLNGSLQVYWSEGNKVLTRTISAPVNIQGSELAGQISIDEMDLYADTVVVDIKIVDYQPVFTIPTDLFKGENRVMFRIDGKYIGETYSGRSYYGNTRINDGVAKFRRGGIALKVGQRLTIGVYSGKPGLGSKLLEELYSYEVKASDLELNVSLNEVSAEIHSNTLHVTMPEELFDSETRIIVRRNGKYAFETYNGSAYYSARTRKNGYVTVRRAIKGLSKTDQFIAQIVAGRPGMSTSIKLQEKSL